VKVVPGSSRSCVDGWLEDALKIRVRAPAERGRANAAVEATLANALGVSRDRVRILRGMTSARKIVEIDDLTLGEVRKRLAERIESSGKDQSV
jgi:uncharacterized protein YggU (UPF0235/DUF167 family)